MQNLDHQNNKIPAQRRQGHSLTACNAAPLAKYKMVARGPQNGRRVFGIPVIFAQ